MRHTARLTASEADVLRSVVGATLSGLVVEFPVVYLMIAGRPIAIVPEEEGIVDSTHPLDEVTRIGVATEQDRRGWYEVRAKGRGSRIVPI